MLAGSVLTGCPADSFTCTTDLQCGPGGVCGELGFCSFPDEQCDSEHRYGEHAPDGLAGTCVPGESGTTGTSMTASGSSDTIASGSDSTTTDSASTTASATVTVTVTVTDTVTDSATTGPASECGNGIVESGEDCEGELEGVTCARVGFDGGELACDADCAYDTSGCTACGDGTIDEGEACDPGASLLVDCSDVGFFAGELGCTQQCEYDTAQCHDCGNGSLDDDELCDGAEIARGYTCITVGYTSSVDTLSCTAECAIDPSDCEGLACGVDAAAGPGDCPPECSGGCQNGTCLIECDDPSECSGDTIICPGDRPCLVVCSSSSACHEASVQCAPLFSCNVQCSGSSACSDLVMTCSEDGICVMDCQSGASVCAGAHVDCGLDNCTTVCDDPNSGPTMSCFGGGASCACNSCLD